MYIFCREVVRATSESSGVQIITGLHDIMGESVPHFRQRETNNISN